MDGQQPPWLCSSTANFHFETDGGTKVTPSPFFVPVERPVGSETNKSREAKALFLSEAEMSDPVG
ncbi:hypothetical protein, partial [Leptospira alstonii]